METDPSHAGRVPSRAGKGTVPELLGSCGRGRSSVCMLWAGVHPETLLNKWILSKQIQNLPVYHIYPKSKMTLNF